MFSCAAAACCCAGHTTPFSEFRSQDFRAPYVTPICDLGYLAPTIPPHVRCWLFSNKPTPCPLLAFLTYTVLLGQPPQCSDMLLGNANAEHKQSSVSCSMLHAGMFQESMNECRLHDAQRQHPHDVSMVVVLQSCRCMAFACANHTPHFAVVHNCSQSGVSAN